MPMKAKHYHMHRMHEPHLKKELSLFDAVVFGVGLIIGAGIYALIGKGAGLAGNALWLSFAIGGAVALFSGLSYAELSSAFSKDAVEYNCAKHATKNRMMSFIVGWLTVFSGIAATATVAVGFGGYFRELTGLPIVVSAALMIAASALTDFAGIKMSTKLIFVLTALEIVGLLFIIGIGAAHISAFGTVNYFDFSGGFEGIFAAATIMFFAYMGFEGVANMSEEIKDSKKNVHIAIILSIVITTVIYMLIAVSTVTIADYHALSQSSAPMSLVADIASKEFNLNLPISAAMSIIALFATASTVMINTVVISRILYGLRSEPALPAFIGKIHPKTKVPHMSIFVVSAAAAAFTLWGDISLLASLSTFAVFLTFLCVNVFLIILRLDRTYKPEFRLPVSVWNIPVTAIIGAAWCVFMLLKFGPATITYSSIVILAGILLFMQAKDNLKRRERL